MYNDKIKARIAHQIQVYMRHGLSKDAAVRKVKNTDLHRLDALTDIVAQTL